mmetsp:Transcript_10079/g.22431  ORF Transcript_10079/g.22431 Transcript_10079/m.22431 type:complete len:550 (+) Transcript_10079:49-1698(+)
MKQSTVLAVSTVIAMMSCATRICRAFQGPQQLGSLFHRSLVVLRQSSTVSANKAAKAVPSSQLSSTTTSKLLNLSTVTKQDLEQFVVNLGHPKFRAQQIWQWIRVQGVTDLEQMTNVPKKLRQQLEEFSKPKALEIAFEMVSKDGTIKRAYKCHDGQVIESVLMPYQDGRYTACISSQAGCAQGCVFCATGQMGFSRQLTPDEIFEQVARFSAELNQQEHSQKKEQKNGEDNKSHGRSKRLSNIVFMGMGEPMANFRHVKTAIQRITNDLGIGARRITISTVGIVPNIRKLHEDSEMPPVRLAVSLHCANDEERSSLLPANQRYGGLKELMTCLKEYMDSTGRRITLEWALIEGQNDDEDTARELGNLVTTQYGLRRDMVHVNVIPLNPTGGFGGSPSGRQRVDKFCQTLEREFGMSCTPRVRRGIDIDAGCGQLKAKVMEKEKSGEQQDSIQQSSDLLDFIPQQSQRVPQVGVYEDDDEEDSRGEKSLSFDREQLSFSIHEEAVDFEEDDYEDPEFSAGLETKEAQRLINLVKGTTIQLQEPQGSEKV